MNGQVREQIEIYCLRCAASTYSDNFCICESPNTYDWTMPILTLSQTSYPKNWNLIGASAHD